MNHSTKYKQLFDNVSDLPIDPTKIRVDLKPLSDLNDKTRIDFLKTILRSAANEQTSIVRVFHNPAFLDDCLKDKVTDLSTCIHVANIATADLGIAYTLTQNINGTIWGKDDFIIPMIPENQRRSTSWGDFLTDNEGVLYFVNGSGFSEIL